MTVLSCHLLDNDFELADRELRYSAKYRIKTNDRSMSAFVVIDNATLASPNPFPSYFSTFSLYGDSDVSAFMQRASCRIESTEQATTWIATANWFPIKGSDSADGHTSREDPLLRPTIYSREWEEISIPVEKGWNEVALTGISRTIDTLGPIQNAAGQEPSTPILTTKRIPVIVAEKNYATLAEIDALERTYGDTLNDAIYATYAEGECVFRGINASKPKYEGGKTYYTATIRIACQRGGWSYEMVNRGWKYLDTGALKEATVEDADGNQVPVAEPINLELDGTRTADGAIGTIIDYRTRSKTNFSAIGV